MSAVGQARPSNELGFRDRLADLSSRHRSLSVIVWMALSSRISVSGGYLEILFPLAFFLPFFAAAASPARSGVMSFE